MKYIILDREAPMMKTNRALVKSKSSITKKSKLSIMNKLDNAVTMVILNIITVISFIFSGISMLP